MSLDPALARMLDDMIASGAPGLHEMGVQPARDLMAMITALDGEAEAVASVQDVSIPSREGPIAARLYRPQGAGSGALGVLLWFHGGGFVIGDLASADPTARKLANRSGALVLSVDYRLAPEHPAPAGVNDAADALDWVAGGGLGPGADPTRLAVAGDSAGGNLAAVTALAARDRSVPLAAQLLVYPWLDLTGGAPSMHTNGDGYLLTRASLEWFAGHYLPPQADVKDWRISPTYASSLAHLAPAMVVTAGYDPLRDEGDAYAAALSAAGVATEHCPYPDMIHGFASMASLTPRAEEMLTAAGRFLRGHLG